MRVYKHAQHAESLVVFYESHPAHVGGKLEDGLRTVRCAMAAIFVLEIRNHVFYFWKDLVPLIQGLHIDCANDIDPFFKEASHEMPSDKSSAAAYDCSPSGQIHV